MRGIVRTSHFPETTLISPLETFALFGIPREDGRLLPKRTANLFFKYRKAKITSEKPWYRGAKRRTRKIGSKVVSRLFVLSSLCELFEL